MSVEELIHAAGLGGVVVALATKPEPLAQLVAHLQEVERLRHELLLEREFVSRLTGRASGDDTEMDARLAGLAPAMLEPDLSLPRPLGELALLLGISRQAVIASSHRPGGRIERIQALVPGSNARYLYKVRADAARAEQHTAGEESAPTPHEETGKP